MAEHFRIDGERCKGEGVCVETCPYGLLEIHEGKARGVAGREGLCIGCGQCVAICPTGALEVPGREIGSFPPLRDHPVDGDALDAFLESRRSCRVFKDHPVDRALLDRIADLASLAPPGFPPSTTEILIIDRRDELDRLERELREGYEKLLGFLRHPIKRAVIRLKRGAETFHTLRTHMTRVVTEKNAWHARTGAERYLYHAPALLLFHGDRWATGCDENALIAGTHAMLAAHALGLGATMLSIVPPLINNMGQAIRPRLGIPEDNRVVTSLIVGHPRYRYQRAIRRPLRSVRYL